VAELREVRYLHQIVVSLDNADGDGYQDAKEFFAVLPQRVRIIWNSGERARKLYDLLDQHGLKVGPGGKATTSSAKGITAGSPTDSTGASPGCSSPR
jgi:glucosyl-3-phosphoglycerate synthase